MNGKKNWFVVDGYRPPAAPDGDVSYEGHECFMILNCNDRDANVRIDVYFEDADPVEDIPMTVPAKRIRGFRSDDESVFGDLKLDVNRQYSVRIRSDVEVVVQYGRCDVAQANLAYLATLGYSE